jgi:O-antigen/teichoic acid export membrane protein
MGVSAATAVLLLIRTTLLTRWVAPESFGIYTLAFAIVAGSSSVATFGLSRAFLHRSSQSRDEERAASTHFTLHTCFSVIWFVILVTSTLLFAQGELSTALIVLASSILVIFLTQTPRSILVRRVQHRRLALLTLTYVLLSTVVALPLAWKGAELWALLATDMVAMVVHVGFLYGWRPVWRPRFSWHADAVRYFIRFGSQNVLADLSSQLLNRLDDIWCGAYLGQTSLGHYSRAYAFSNHPGRLIASPVNAVVGGTYAELKDDRVRLSKAFFRVTAFLVRSGFLLACVLFLVMPEFIALFLTDAWWPMLPAFRIVVIFMLLRPIAETTADLFVAVGNPRKIVHVRLIQLLVLVVSLYVFGMEGGVAGVAVAVVVMLTTGIVLLLSGSRQYVDYSMTRLFLVPVVALGLGLSVPYLVLGLTGATAGPGATLVLKLALFGTTYMVIWLTLERNEVKRMWSAIRRGLTGEYEETAVLERTDSYDVL